MNQGKLSSWVTLFDDPEDDLFDGKLNEDDREFPRILLEFFIDGGLAVSPRRSVHKSPAYQKPDHKPNLERQQSPEIRNHLDKRLVGYEEEDPLERTQIAEDVVTNKKMEELVVLIKDRTGEQYPAIIILAQETHTMKDI